MDKLVAIVFPEQSAAREGVRVLYALDREGSIEVCTLRLIRKNEDGTVAQERIDDDFPPPSRTVTGLALGTVIGVLGGPLGLTAGVVAGSLIGLAADLYEVEVDIDFLSDVSAALRPGGYAVLAEIEEEKVTPVDVRMERLGGVVFRTVRSATVHENQIRGLERLRAQIDQLVAEHADARAERRKKLQHAIDGLRARLQLRLTHSQVRARQASDEAQARVQALKNRAQREQGDAKAALEARIARLRHNFRQQHRD